MSTRPCRIVVSTGEPAGVGPELCAIAAHHMAREFPQVQCIWVGDAALLRSRGMPVDARIHHVALCEPSIPGQLRPGNAAYVLTVLDEAIACVAQGNADALVTAPVHKGVINDGLISRGLKDSTSFFSGHTEYLQAAAGVDRVVMMLTGAGLRVALATTHLALQAVPTALSVEALSDTLCVLDAALRRDFAIASPRIAVCGLNPHAGEGGHLGTEEQTVIAPAIEAARLALGRARLNDQAASTELTGPWPADTLFAPEPRARVDAIVAMYHDQGLGPLKALAFHQAVNVTLGLPWIRTSVDHGTALDLAGTGRADPGSLHAALALAVDLAQARAQQESLRHA